MTARFRTSEDERVAATAETCPKCGGDSLSVRFRAHCLRRDCDHKYCGEALDVTCGTCGFKTVRRPLDARGGSHG